MSAGEKETLRRRENKILDFLEQLTTYGQIHKSVDADLQLTMRQYIAAKNSKNLLRLPPLKDEIITHKREYYKEIGVAFSQCTKVR